MEFDATFIIAAISFIVFVFIMNLVLYKPIFNIMKQRQELVEQNFQTAALNIKETEKQTVYHDSELEKSRESARGYISSNSKELKENQSREISGYKEHLNSQMADAKTEMLNSALEAKETLKDNTVDIAKSISSIILGDVIDKEKISKTRIEEP